MKRQKIFTILCLFWMVVIFLFSSQDATVSTKESNTIGLIIGHVIHSDFDTWSLEDRNDFARRWDYVIRKTAHMTEYAVLGFLCVGAMMGHKTRIRVAGIRAFIISVVYAMSDEFHQIFVPGRAGMITDVGIDTIGVMLGVVVGCVVLVWIYRGVPD